MIKASDKHKAIFWHVYKTGGSYVEYILDRYYDFNISWPELNEHTNIEKTKEMEVYFENIKKEEVELQEKLQNIKLAIEIIKKDINWEKKGYFIHDDTNNIELDTLSNCEEFEIDIKNEKINILLYDKKQWNKKTMKNKGLLGSFMDVNRNTDLINIPLTKWKTYFKFCVVRNPYDRAISSYEFLKQRDKDTRLHPVLNKEECDFKYLFTHEEDLSHNSFMYFHAYASQVTILKDNLYGIKMDYIAKYEHLDEEIVYILKQMGITEFPHLQLVKDNITLNKTKKKGIDTYFDQEMLQIINEKFKEDFKAFGYEMYTNVQELNEHLLELNNAEFKNKQKINLLNQYYDEHILTKHSAFI